MSVGWNDCPDDGDEAPCESERVENVERSCGLEPQRCEENGDCAAGFVCQQIAVPCPPRTTIACDEGEDCPEPEVPDCPEETEGHCVFDPTPCENDDPCLDGWSCETIEETTCSGQGSVPVDGGEGSSSGGGGVPQPEPAPEPDEPGEEGDEVPAPEEDVPAPMEAPAEPIDEQEERDDECETVSVQICLPDGYEHYLGGPSAASPIAESGVRNEDADAEAGGGEDLANSGAAGSPGDDNGAEAAGSADSDDDGCACSSSSTKGQPLFGLFMVILAAGILRRRRM